jgi:hypothetical protein
MRRSLYKIRCSNYRQQRRHDWHKPNFAVSFRSTGKVYLEGLPPGVLGNLARRTRFSSLRNATCRAKSWRWADARRVSSGCRMRPGWPERNLAGNQQEGRVFLPLWKGGRLPRSTSGADRQEPPVAAVLRAGGTMVARSAPRHQLRGAVKCRAQLLTSLVQFVCIGKDDSPLNARRDFHG